MRCCISKLALVITNSDKQNYLFILRDISINLYELQISFLVLHHFEDTACNAITMQGFYESHTENTAIRINLITLKCISL